MEKVEIIGSDSLDESEKGSINKLVGEYYPKIQRALKNDTSLILHIKSKSKGGKRKHYSVTLRAIAPTITFESSAEEWDIASALHKSFGELIHIILHRFKNK